MARSRRARDGSGGGGGGGEACAGGTDRAESSATPSRIMGSSCRGSCSLPSQDEGQVRTKVPAPVLAGVEHQRHDVLVGGREGDEAGRLGRLQRGRPEGWTRDADA